MKQFLSHLSVLIPTLLVGATLYQFGYWNTFSINGFQFIPTSELAISSIYPILSNGIFMFSIPFVYWHVSKQISADIQTKNNVGGKETVLKISIYIIIALLLTILNTLKADTLNTFWGWYFWLFVQIAILTLLSIVFLPISRSTQELRRISSLYFIVSLYLVYCFSGGKIEALKIQHSYNYNFIVNSQSQNNSKQDTLKLLYIGTDINIYLDENNLVFMDRGRSEGITIHRRENLIFGILPKKMLE